jgi:flavodoxin
MGMITLLILYSYHHMNTEKVAKAMGEVLDAQIKTPSKVDPKELGEYDLVGFGSGIYGSKHHKSLLSLADKLPQITDGKAFIFSTSGAPASALEGGHLDDYIVKAHAHLKKKLQSKGYMIVDEFMCAGWNTNSFLKLFGGINKGRPNAQDLENARDFAARLKKNLLN